MTNHRETIHRSKHKKFFSRVDLRPLLTCTSPLCLDGDRLMGYGSDIQICIILIISHHSGMVPFRSGSLSFYARHDCPCLEANHGQSNDAFVIGQVMMVVFQHIEPTIVGDCWQNQLMPQT